MDYIIHLTLVSVIFWRSVHVKGWSEWGECQLHHNHHHNGCGEGTQWRQDHSCHHGHNCVQSQTCSIHCSGESHFDLGGVWSTWTEFSSCSASCGHGLMFKTRTCISPQGHCEGEYKWEKIVTHRALSMVVGVVGRHFPNVQQHVEEAYRQGQGHVPTQPLLMADNLVLATRTPLNIATHTAVQLMGDGVIGPDITVVQYHVEGEQRRGQGHVLTQSQHTEAMIVLVTWKKVNNAMSMPALLMETGVIGLHSPIALCHVAGEYSTELDHVTIRTLLM
uniref:Uncharacterized protein LOC111129037 isoform X1 n=1 Tax=Crassostrea virginica TaxID=6565 RepID=A0A8B8DRE1_CRAVI|nr:uncharacterized protein LOC111129037 isoform X1 [Crassostrea virginica]